MADAAPDAFIDSISKERMRDPVTTVDCEPPSTRGQHNPRLQSEVIDQISPAAPPSPPARATVRAGVRRAMAP